MAVTYSFPNIPATLPVDTLTEAAFFRITRTKYGGSEPFFNNAGVYRFDDPTKQFKTLYCAHDFKTCFLETVIRDSADLNISKADFDSRSAVFLLLKVSDLKLVPIYGDHAVNMGLDFAKIVGTDYGFTQALAKEIHDHSDEPHGMIYKSRFNSEAMAVVLFDRANPLVRLYPGSSHVAFKDAIELCDAVRNSIKYKLV